MSEVRSRFGVRRHAGASLLAAVAVAALAGLGSAGCGGRSSSSGALSSSTVAASTSRTPGAAPSPTSSPAPVVTGTAAQPAPDVVPLICLHGITGHCEDWTVFLDLYGPGRAVVRSLYAGEADRLRPGDLPAGVVVAAGYYQESASSPRYDPDASGRGQDSIGGCPVPRTDPYASQYPISYVERVGRIVDGVRRATGCDRVDLALHSMGNIVGRAYTRWHSDGAAGGKSKVRRIFSITGPHRGINAIEAFAFGFVRPQDQLFMRQGEVAEMCEEYRVWGGRSYVELLNDGWDAFCAQEDVRYGGLSSIGARGTQNNPNGLLPVVSTAVQGVLATLHAIQMHGVGDLYPFWQIAQTNVAAEAVEALGPGDGVVRLASSRLDVLPFSRADFWLPFEGRHDSNWNPEQSVVSSTVTHELAEEYLSRDRIATTASVSSFDLGLVDAPGRASWLRLDVTAAGGDLAGAQLVEERLDAQGHPSGGAQGYGASVHEGAQTLFFQVPAGGGARRYHLVLYGASGKLATRDVDLGLTDGALDSPPTTTFVGATPSAAGTWPVVHATFASNAAPNDPTLALAFRLDGGPWTAWAPSASFDTPTLGPGEHRLEARARHASNGARVLCEDPRGVAVGLVVDASGAVTVRP